MDLDEAVCPDCGQKHDGICSYKKDSGMIKYGDEGIDLTEVF